MKLIQKASILLAMLAAPALAADAGGFAVKTNLLYDATASVNLGFEAPLAPQWSLDINGDVNFWNIGERRWRHWFVQPEARYWFCHRSIGSFIAIQAHGGQYNIGNLGGKGFSFLGTDYNNLVDKRYQGWFAGAGVAYGYAVPFSAHWGMEFEIGVGWAYSKYDAYPCRSCGSKIESGVSHHYFGLTKAAINLVYSF